MQPNPLASLRIDRAAERREDADWLKRALTDSETRFLLVHQGRILVADGPRLAVRWMTVDELPGSPESFIYWAFLGIADDRPVVLLEVELRADAEQLSTQFSGRWVGARQLALTGEPVDAGIAAYGRALSLWRVNHRHCGRCGTQTRADQAGFRLLCQNDDCRHQHFPRLDPAVIVAVGHDQRLLLGRQPSWPPGRYSTLAGFVEPGESLEDAIVREVAEESGVVIGGTRYHSSQPWPFPSSLMVGFMATATNPALQLGDELEQAQWFDADELATALDRREVILPPPLSISRRLIVDWFAEHHQVDINQWKTVETWS